MDLVQRSQQAGESERVKEDLLQYIWKMKVIPSTNLITVQGKELEVLRFGTINRDEGPDFLDGRILLDGVEFAGSIEIHVKSSHWHQHRHSESQLYDNVILHVVFEDDQQINNTHGQLIPTLELKPLVDPSLLSRYRRLMRSNSSVPCSNNLHQVDQITWNSIKDRMFAERLDSKYRELRRILRTNNNDWESVLYLQLFKYAAMGVNSADFFDLAMSVPFNVVRKLGDDRFALEAIFFGQSNLLEVEHSYAHELRGEYEYQKQKFGLKENYLRLKFSRMRPANFPTLRLAQLVALFAGNKNLFRDLMETESYPEVFDLLSQPPIGFWENHYSFTSPGKQRNKGFGHILVRSLVINVITPITYAYGKHLDDPDIIYRARNLLDTVPGEDNRITRIWNKLGVESSSAYNSQALLQLYKHYCSAKKCLNCGLSSKTLLGK